MRARCIISCSGRYAVALLLAAGLLWTPARAAPEGADRGESEAKAAELPHPGLSLKDAVKNLAKLESYKVTLRIEGGLSKSEDHRVSQRTFNKTYSADVYANKLMYVPDMEAYRLPGKGVRLSGGTWKNVLADRTGLLLDRLFDYPLDVLNKAYRHSRNAEWVMSSVADEEVERIELELDDLFEPEDEPGSKAERGKTIVAESADDEEKVRLPRILRVEAPPKEALHHFLSVEKSGCIGGG